MSIGEVPWDRFEGPEWYEPSSVPGSLEAMASAQTGEEAWWAYNAVLFAIGNNHAGTFYPAVVAALPLILEMAEADRPWTRFAAVQVALDCATSFQPEPGFETTQLPDGDVCDVGATVRRQLDTARHRLQRQLDGERHSQTRAALGELLAQIPGHTGDP